MVKRSMRYYYLRLVRQPGTPEQIAGGMALGLFLAMVVPPGLQMVAALALAILFKLNKVGALLGCLVTNPLTWPTIILFQLACGSYVTGIEVPRQLPVEYESWWQFLHDFRASWHILRAYLTGAAITGIISAVAGYFLTRWGVEGFRRRKQLRLYQRLKRAIHPPAEGDDSGVPAAPPAPHMPADPPPEPDKS